MNTHTHTQSNLFSVCLDVFCEKIAIRAWNDITAVVNKNASNAKIHQEKIEEIVCLNGIYQWGSVIFNAIILKLCNKVRSLACMSIAYFAR